MPSFTLVYMSKCYFQSKQCTKWLYIMLARYYNALAHQPISAFGNNSTQPKEINPNMCGPDESVWLSNINEQQPQFAD